MIMYEKEVTQFYLISLSLLMTKQYLIGLGIFDFLLFITAQSHVCHFMCNINWHFVFICQRCKSSPHYIVTYRVSPAKLQSLKFVFFFFLTLFWNITRAVSQQSNNTGLTSSLTTFVHMILHPKMPVCCSSRYFELV